MEVTKREIQVSAIIIIMMIVIGILISTTINNYYINKNENYYKALQINNDNNIFDYALKTNVGSILAYGKLESIDTVALEELEGEYIAINKIKEEYTMHTRTVTETIENLTQTRTEIYYTWDYVSTEKLSNNQVNFMGRVFNTGDMKLNNYNRIDSKKGLYNYKDSTTRYYYEVINKEDNILIGGATTEDNNMKVKEVYNKKIDEFIISLEKTGKIVTIMFWVGWVFLIILLVSAFVYIDNKWLEN